MPKIGFSFDRVAVELGSADTDQSAASVAIEVVGIGTVAGLSAELYLAFGSTGIEVGLRGAPIEGTEHWTTDVPIGLPTLPVGPDDLARFEQLGFDGAAWEAEQEFSSNELATAWAFCLAKELGQTNRAERLRRFLAPKVEEGFELDPYITGLFLLGERLERGAFHRLVNGVSRTS